MKKYALVALTLVTLILAAGGGGYWLGRRQAEPVGPAAATGQAEAFAFLRYDLRRGRPPKDEDRYYYVSDDDDDRVKASRPVQEVCLNFNRPLAKAESYEGRIRVEGVEKLTVATRQQALCVAGWPANTTKLDLTIPAGLAAADGAKTAEETKLRIDFNLPVKEKLVAIAGTGFILPQVGANGIAVETRNVDRIRMRVLRVTDTKLMREWPKPKQKRQDSGEDDEYYYYESPMTRLLAGGAYVVWDGTMAVDNRGDERVTTSFPITRILPERRPGAYLLIAEEDAKATATTGYYYYSGAPASRWIIETDIGLTVLQGEDGLHLLARSYETAKPVAGLEVALVAEDGKDLGRAPTDKEGRVRFDRSLLQGRDGNRPHAVFAYGENGAFAFLDLNRPAFDLSDRGVSGQPALRPIAAFLYADRGIYRPGESVHLSGLMRRDNADALDSPLTLVIQRPNGAEFRRHTLKPDAGGGVHLTAELPPAAARGLWTVQAYADPTDRPVGRLSFEVQDFVPRRRNSRSTPSGSTARPLPACRALRICASPVILRRLRNGAAGRSAAMTIPSRTCWCR